MALYARPTDAAVERARNLRARRPDGSDAYWCWPGAAFPSIRAAAAISDMSSVMSTVSSAMAPHRSCRRMEFSMPLRKIRGSIAVPLAS